MTRDEVLDNKVQAVFRRGAWVAAVGALLVGAFGLIFPVAALRSIALLFGIYLVVAGISRVSTAVTADRSVRRWRWLVGIMGVIVIVAGVLCLVDPFASLVAIEIIVGVGWIVDGVICIAAAFALFRAGTRAALVLTGAVSLILGIVVLLIPGAAILAFLFIAAIFLAVIGVVGIVGLLISGARIRHGRG